jgi:hypothetical protein
MEKQCTAAIAVTSFEFLKSLQFSACFILFQYPDLIDYTHHQSSDKTGSNTPID